MCSSRSPDRVSSAAASRTRPTSTYVDISRMLLQARFGAGMIAACCLVAILARTDMTDLKGILLPIYSYTCTGCGAQLDVRQAMADAPLTSCPSCQARLRKLITAPLVMTGASLTRLAVPRAGGGCSPGAGCCG